MMTTSTKRIKSWSLWIGASHTKVDQWGGFLWRKTLFLSQKSSIRWHSTLFFGVWPKKRHYVNNSSENFCFCFHPWISFGHVYFISQDFDINSMGDRDSNSKNPFCKEKIERTTNWDKASLKQTWNSQKQSSGESIATYQDNYKIQNKRITAKTKLEFINHKIWRHLKL
jgi:hypothetical protein